jgi:phytanoyl-CoA hydroxylase
MSWNTEQIISDLYQALLGRGAQRDEINYWEQQISSGLGVGELVTAFTSSEEYLNRHVAEIPGASSLPKATDPHRHPVETPHFRSRFGGLWTDLSNAQELVAGRLAIGEITGADAENLSSFIKNGYVILPGAVPMEAIDALNRDVALLVEDPPPEAWVNLRESNRFVTRPFRPADARAADNVLKLLDLYSFLPSARDVIFADATHRFLKLIFMRPVMVHQSLFFFYGSQQNLHKDTAYVHVSSPMEFAASWTALEDVQPGSGELIYYASSHNDPEYLFEGKWKWCAPGVDQSGFYQHLNNIAEKSRGCAQVLRINKGDVLIWAADLTHGGSPIEDRSATRQSIVAHYCPSNLSPMYKYIGGASEIEDYGSGRFGCAANKVYWSG